MPSNASAFNRDANRVPITQNGLMVTKSLTFTGDDATVATPIFNVTGVVEVLALYGIVITQLGAGHTDAHWRLNDHTASDIILTKATTLSIGGISPGAMIFKSGLITAVATYKTSDAASMYEPTTLQTNLFTPFIVVQKTGGIVTHIEYVYTTDDDPTSGTMKFYCGFIPLSDDGDITAA